MVSDEYMGASLCAASLFVPESHYDRVIGLLDGRGLHSVFNYRGMSVTAPAKRKGGARFGFYASVPPEYDGREAQVLKQMSAKIDKLKAEAGID
jgi:hypothetical protein